MQQRWFPKRAKPIAPHKRTQPVLEAKVEQYKRGGEVPSPQASTMILQGLLVILPASRSTTLEKTVRSTSVKSAQRNMQCNLTGKLIKRHVVLENTDATVVLSSQDELVHDGELYRTSWHLLHFLKDYIFYLGRLLVIFLDRCMWIKI
ncbi:hypothetical protein HYC85_021202 [Camellia sinensis]|uniref:Uncharacterized protein n=1 Tax=Camellia sinensis TaxID=4442 RepID=A0A7J7GIF7_CAMSI|nr:hypothetical protein HYC85_021202 [Camellia sinensis]